MDSCDHENDHDSIVVYGKVGCGICFLLKALEDSEDNVAALKNEIANLK